MARKFLITITLLIGFISFSQRYIVVDDSTHLPVPFVSYSLFKDGTIIGGGYSNEKGSFSIKKEFSKLVLTCIGYENLELVHNSIKKDTFRLKPIVYHLNEVVIDPKLKKETALLGNYNTKLKSLLGAATGMEICTFIENPYHEPKPIQSVLFKIRNHSKNKVGFKIHLYERDSVTGEPKRELITQDIVIISEESKKEKIEFNVRAYDLELPANGAFLGIEWLGNLDEENNTFENTLVGNGYIELNDSSNAKNTFERNRFSFYSWVSMKKFKKKVEDYVTYNNLPNASFGLKIITN
ncbi:MAG: hypothetical protein ACK5RV_02045 [Flavobacterium sp.]|jgi:hypothetical protein|uniref:hypothetical protein n=1 Tax=Flavobacterium sp. TaxID=239 RepID=UPI0022C0F641|nr:hypothetical protein [Flavobacterium sp.]MCZ8169123.1 hypothetical protein [Flavobacterium sp.]MCZ8297816.1 hypothetical protein [Flavobacterium sp.]